MLVESASNGLDGHGRPAALHGVHHTARPTWKLKETVHFYRDVLGLKLCHAICARGWGPDKHPDFLHFFFDSGAGSTIAFFYYLNTDKPADAVPPGSTIYNAVHTAWRVESRAELAAWKEKLEKQGFEVMRVPHEILESIYVTDPNGYVVEIAWQTRDMNRFDGVDAGLTLDAAIGIEQETGSRVQTVDEIWQRKAGLVGDLVGDTSDGPRIHVLDVPEFAGLVERARARPGVTVSAPREGYVTISAPGELTFDRRECGFKPAIWYSCLCGGLDGTIVEFGRDSLRIVGTAR